MSFSIRHGVVVGAACLLASCTLGLRPAEGDSRWRRVVTPRFTYFSTSHPDDVARTARELESMAVVLGQLGLGAPAGCRPRTVLIGFADRGAFNPHRPLSAGRPIKIEGYCARLPFGNWIGFLESELRGRLIARHEYAHTVIADAFWRVPTCLNEGMAEFLSTFQVEDKEISFGHPIDWHRAVVQSSDLLSLNDLFGTDAESLNAMRSEAQALVYAESWALVHYLARDGFDGLIGFVQAIARGEEARTAFGLAFPAERWDEVPGRLKSYVDSEVRRYHAIPIGKIALPAPDAIALADAAPGQALAHVGLWRLYADVDSVGTRACFDQASREDSTLAIARAGRGILSILQQRYEEAAQRLHPDAVGSSDAQAMFIAGFGLLQIAQASGRAGRGGMSEEAYRMLAGSVAMDSTDANALAWYAQAGAALGDYSDGVIRALERASNALPADPVLAADLAALLARAGAVRRSASVRAGLTHVVPGSRPTNDASVASAADSLVGIYNQGILAAGRGDFEQARRLFESVVASAATGEARDSAQAMIQRLRGRREFERGVEAARGGDLAAAVRWFEKVLEVAMDEELRARAGRFLGEARAAQTRPERATTPVRPSSPRR